MKIVCPATGFCRPAAGDYDSKKPERTPKGPRKDIVMPLMRVTLTPGAFDDAGKERLVAGLTEAACRAESVPDQPQHRMRALVLLHELAPGCFYSAGVCADAALAGVFIDWQVSTGSSTLPARRDSPMSSRRSSHRPPTRTATRWWSRRVSSTKYPKASGPKTALFADYRTSRRLPASST